MAEKEVAEMIFDRIPARASLSLGILKRKIQMPFINGRFYMNPAYGRAVERTLGAQAASKHSEPHQQDQGAHWVTIGGKHVPIRETQAVGAKHGT